MRGLSSYDAVVVGLGIYGSAALDALAGSGLRVLGLERFLPPHERGSSHGHTRMIRQAYFEDPVYVPLVKRAYELWEELGEWAGRPLLVRCGGVMAGPPDGTVVAGTLASARLHGLEHEVLDADACRRRFPQLGLEPGEVAVFEPEAGVLAAEPCLQALLARAVARGAEVRAGVRVTGWRRDGSGVAVETTAGEVRAAALLICAGGWLPSLVPQLAESLWVERQVQCWFEPGDPAAFRPGTFPAFILERRSGAKLYGIPPLGGEGVKVAFHHGGERCEAENVRRTVEAEETAAVSAAVAERLPGLRTPPHRTAVCLYTNSPDEHFLLGPHPEAPGVWIVSCCSGHGFKFAPAVGEALARWIVSERRPELLEGAPFDPTRCWPRG